MGLEIVVYDSVEQCADIIKEFQKKEPINIFFTYEWMTLWKMYFAPKMKERILVFQEGDEIIGYMPLVYKKRIILPFTIYHYYGIRKSNYTHLPVKRGRVADIYDSAFEFFKQGKKRVILCIDNINNSSDDYLVLSEKSNGWKFLQHLCPYARTDRSWDNFFSRHFKKSKRRSKLRSFKSKLERTGGVSFVRINDYESYLKHKELLEQTFFIHKLRFQNEINSSGYSDGRHSDFYRNVFREFALLKILDMSLICIDNIVISFVMALRQQETLIHYVPGFHIAFKCYSLGHLHLMNLFHAIIDEQQIKCFDFSLGTEEYKNRWADDVTSNYSFIFRFNADPLVRFAVFCINCITKLKLFGRNKGWNRKIKKLIGRLSKKNKAATEGVQIVPSSFASINPSEETAYSFSMLMTMPVKVQTFVIEQLYIGKAIDFLLKENKIIGIKTKDAKGDRFYKIC